MALPNLFFMDSTFIWPYKEGDQSLVGQRIDETSHEISDLKVELCSLLNFSSSRIQLPPRYSKWYHRAAEAQKKRGWQGPLEILQSTSPLKAGPTSAVAHIFTLLQPVFRNKVCEWACSCLTGTVQKLCFPRPLLGRSWQYSKLGDVSL